MGEVSEIVLSGAENKELKVNNNPYFDILASGRFGVGQINVTQNLQEEYPQELKEAIEAVWSSRNQARAQAGHPLLEATPQLKLKSVATEDGNLVIELSEGTYKDHIAWQDKAFKEKFKDFDPKIIGTNIVVKTADDQLMIVQRGLGAATKPGAMSVVGGQWDITKDCDEKGSWDPFRTITRELEEETGIKRDEIDNLTATGIIYNKAANNPSMIFCAESSLNADQIRERIGDGEVLVKFIPDEEKDVEHSILWWTSSPSPSGASALALYGRDKFGEEWFDKVNQRINYRHARLYSNLTSDQLKQVDSKAARRLSKL